MSTVEKAARSWDEARRTALRHLEIRNRYKCLREKRPADADRQFDGGRPPCWKADEPYTGQPDGPQRLPRHLWCLECQSRQLAHEEHRKWNRSRGARLVALQRAIANERAIAKDPADLERQFSSIRTMERDADPKAGEAHVEQFRALMSQARASDKPTMVVYIAGDCARDECRDILGGSVEVNATEIMRAAAHVVVSGVVAGVLPRLASLQIGMLVEHRLQELGQ